MAVWNWVQANDPSGATFAAQQFGGLFSTAFLRTRDAGQQTIEFLSSNPHPIEFGAYARHADAYLAYDPAGYLAGIRAPTLVLVAEQDLPPWIAREVAAAIPGARLEIIAGDWCIPRRTARASGRVQSAGDAFSGDAAHCGRGQAPPNASAAVIT